MAYVSDETACREHLATLHNQIAMEEAIIIERVNRYRSFLRDEALEYKERDEWAHFNDRVRPLRQEIEAITNLLADHAALRSPAPRSFQHKR